MPVKVYYTVSGWIKSNANDVYSDIIHIENSPVNMSELYVDLEPIGQWKYFSFMFYMPANILYVRTDMREKVSTRDVRITFQETGVLKDDDVSHTNIIEYVLLNGNSEISFNDVQFYYCVNNSNIEAQGVTFSDVLRYKLRKKREGIYNEGYYNNCKNVMTGTTDLRVLHNGNYISISNFDLGVRVYSNGKKSLTKINVDENNQSSEIVKTYVVEETIVSTEKLDNNLDVTESTIDNVTTEYVRNSQGLVTRESVTGLYRHDTVYSDTLITVSDVNTDTNEIISATKYYLNPTWGGVEKVEVLDSNGAVQSVVGDSYDGDMSVLKQKAFDNNSTRKNTFDYSNGRLSSMTYGALNYTFGYTTDTGELASVSKNGASIEQHAYSKSNGETSVESNYPSLSSALYTETKVFDKYGRLKEVNGVLENSYDNNPYWYYFDDNIQIHTTMENYDRAVHGELSQSTASVDSKDGVLSQTTDYLANEVIKYGYEDGKLTAAVTYVSGNYALRQETFVYDDIGRMTRDNFNYNLTTSDCVSSNIVYATAASAPLADNRVSSYTYKVNGAEKAKTENTYDSYKRVTNKKYTVGGKVFTKSVGYDKTKVGTITDKIGYTTVLQTTTYQYESTGKIIGINNGSPITYEYDGYGQLVRENNKPLDKTFVYAYNNIGNVVSVKTYNYTTGSLGSEISRQSFGYDTTYPDRLTSCGGTSISYNSTGCPTTYNGYTASWTRGKLAKLTKGLKASGIHNYYYNYNALGQRTSRSYTYSLPTLDTSAVAMGMLIGYSQAFCYDQSGRLVYESKTSQYYGEGSGTERKVYLYDETDIIGMVYTAESGMTNTYYFQRNLLGDVVGIYDTNGNKVAGYVYDAWGNHKVLNPDGTENTSVSFIGNINPFRYRGYYYDEDAKLYYLSARYYCPEWCRFISPDDTAYLDAETINGLNLYVYCNNNPVMNVDPSGHIILSLIIASALGAAVATIMSIAVQGLTSGEINWAQVGISALFGAVGGLLSFTGIGGVVGQFLIQGALGVGELYSMAALNGTVDAIGVEEVVATFLFAGGMGTLGANNAAKKFQRISQMEASFNKYMVRDIKRYAKPILSTIMKRGATYFKTFVLETIKMSAISGGINTVANIFDFWMQKFYETIS